MIDTVRVMTENEAEGFVTDLLKEKGPLSTAQILDESSGKGLKCPESTGSFLARMRFHGKIQGRFVPEKKAWMWSVVE